MSSDDDFLSNFVSGMRNSKTGGIVTSVKEMRENQFGFPLKHYAQQYLFGSTALRIQVFNSFQGQKEVGKSTLLFDLIGDVCGAIEDGGLGGIGVIYELEGKISPSILSSILSNHGERALKACMPRLGLTLEEAMDDLNSNVIPLYKKLCPKRDKPLILDFDSIGGSAVNDTVDKLKKEGVAGKGYYNKQHFMKYFCENQGMIFTKENIPVVVCCVNQEKTVQGATPFAPPQKTITGGTAQMFKDGNMISVTRQKLDSGNRLFLSTAKTSFCDPRKIQVEFRWNKFGRKVEDAYEAHFLWGLAAAECIAKPEKGVDEIRDICEVSISDGGLVTCRQLGLKSVPADEFETALMSSGDLLEQLYVHQKIEKLRPLDDFYEYMKSKEPGAKKAEEEEAKPKKASRTSVKKKTVEPLPLLDTVEDSRTDADQ